jgi:hypothetical protein
VARRELWNMTMACGGCREGQKRSVDSVLRARSSRMGRGQRGTPLWADERGALDGTLEATESWGSPACGSALAVVTKLSPILFESRVSSRYTRLVHTIVRDSVVDNCHYDLRPLHLLPVAAVRNTAGLLRMRDAWQGIAAQHARPPAIVALPGDRSCRC